MLAEFAAHDPDRLAVSYQVPIIDIAYAVAEVERLAGLGARSVHLPELPERDRPARLPRSGATTRSGACCRRRGSRSATTSGNRHWLYDIFRRDPTPQAAIFTSMPALALSEVIAWWILTGTLERFPGLKIVFVEPSLYWVPGFLASLDRKADGATTCPACA